jgi:hypothetical protein
MGRPPHDLAGGAAIQPWPSSRRSRTRPPRGDHVALPARARGQDAAPATRGRARRGPPRRALAGLPQQARAGSRGALRAGAGYLAGQLARAARGEHIAFAVSARPIAPLGRLPDAAADDDWREPAGTDAARAAVADYRPGWCPADALLLLRRARAGLLTGRCGEPTVALGRRAGPVLLIVMYEAQTWRVRPGEPFTFGRSPQCSAVLPAADRGLSRTAGSFRHHGGWWWLHNDSGSSVLCLLGDRGFRVDLPPGLQVPLQQWHAKVTLTGVLDRYTLRLRLPGLDDLPDPGGQRPGTGEAAVTSTRYRAPLTGTDRLVLAARFEAYLTWRHAGDPAPRSARETAERIGWQAHTVAKRCENIRDRYVRLGAPGLRGPRALEQLALLLISTGELTAADLRRLPASAPPG